MGRSEEVSRLHDLRSDGGLQDEAGKIQTVIREGHRFATMYAGS